VLALRSDDYAVVATFGAEENVRYSAELAQCHRMPLSERNTCISDAGTAAALATRS
jgi:hypothetical protein